MKNDNKLYYLDVLRAISFVFIIIYHFILELEQNGIYNFTQNGIVCSNKNIGIDTLGVGLFFMISGAGLMMSKRSENIKTFYSKRFFRILVPFYLVYIANLLAYIVLKGKLPFEAGIAKWKIIYTIGGMDGYLHVLGEETFTQGVGEWFLGCLIIIYIIFPLLRKCMLKNKWLMLIFATVLYLVLVFNYKFNVVQSANLFLKTYQFILGMFLGMLWEKVSKKSLLITIPVIGVFLFYKESLPFPMDFKITIICLAVYISVMQMENIIKKSDFLGKVLGWVRNNSYEVFLIHHIIIYFAGDLLSGKRFNVIEVIILFVIEICMMIFGTVILKKVEEIIYLILRKFHKNTNTLKSL